jgi:hypothetical protein
MSGFTEKVTSWPRSFNRGISGEVTWDVAIWNYHDGQTHRLTPVYHYTDFDR